MIIDGTDMILGRLATQVAKRALLGEKIDIVNAEKTVMTGDPKKLLAKFKNARERGAPLVGPYVPRTPERLVKRTIRGMLPYKKSKGREAFSRIKCHVGVPEEFQKQKMEVIKEAHVNKTHTKYIAIKEISRFLGAKVE